MLASRFCLMNDMVRRAFETSSVTGIRDWVKNPAVIRGVATVHLCRPCDVTLRKFATDLSLGLANPAFVNWEWHRKHLLQKRNIAPYR